RLLSQQRVDCLLVPPQLISEVEGLVRSEEEKEIVLGNIPVIVYGEGEIDELAWKRLSRTYPIRKARSPERLLDRVTSALHRDLATLPDKWRKKLLDLHQSDKPLAGKKVLIVDDDT